MAEIRIADVLAAGLGFDRAKELRLTDAALYADGGDLRSSASGQRVTPERALQLSAVWGCVRLISQAIATLPCNLYVTRRDGNRELATDLQLFDVLKNRPAATMTASNFWQSLMTSLLLRGNAAAVKVESGGQVIGLRYLRWDFLTYRRLDRAGIEWRYRDPELGTDETFTDSQVWHVAVFTGGGRFGLSPIRYGASVMGGAMAAEDAAAKTWANNLRRAGVVHVDEPFLKPEQREDIRRHVKAAQESGGVMVLEKGQGFEPLSLDPNDAELLASRAWGVEEVCRWFGVPPFMVGHGEKSSTWGASLEEQKIAFVAYLLRPWCKFVEDHVREFLLPRETRLGYSCEFELEGLLRGNSTARASFYATALQNGWMTRDEVRRLENRAAMGGNAQVLTVQSNLLPLDKLGEGTDPADNAREALSRWLGGLDSKAAEKVAANMAAIMEGLNQ